jgi:two-component system sensor histidine kinase YesM
MCYDDNEQFNIGGHIKMITAGIKKFYHKHIHIRFYTRLMICYTLIFVLVTYVSAFIGTKYYSEYETVKKLQESRTALNAICSYYILKQSELPDIILPFYQTQYDGFNLDTILRSPTDELYSKANGKKEMVEVLQKVADRDGDIEQILLYKNINGSKYVYKVKDRTIEMVEEDYPYFEEMAKKETGRIITGTRTTGRTTAYGIGGVVGIGKDAGAAGKYLIAYNTAALSSILKGYSGTYGRFVLVSLTGDIIYDSEGKYDEMNFTYIEELLSGEENISIDGQDCHIQTIRESKAKIIAANIVPGKELKNNKFSLMVYGVLSLMAGICAGLYMIGGYFISRKLKEIENAMKLVGSNNLTYRIPITDPSDEFEEIAVKFNRMCDELQQTIEREYISEIKKKNAELASLQAGINPHFLYNTLEVIRVKAVDSGSGDVAKMIVTLANLYRMIVRDDTFISIRKETMICDMYMDLFSYHYENSLDYEMNMEPRINEYGIPKNLLQPIIENYFVHGIKDIFFANQFKVRGFLIDGDICFIFENNGQGINKEELEEIRRNIEAVKPEAESGYGLLNIQKRIRLVYGEPYGIKLESEENKMTRITVLIKAMTCDELKASLASLEEV